MKQHVACHAAHVARQQRFGALAVLPWIRDQEASERCCGHITLAPVVVAEHRLGCTACRK